MSQDQDELLVIDSGGLSNTKANLHLAVRRLCDLRQKIAQPVRDMQSLGCEYDFISTYNHTIVPRQFQ